jgi:ribosomal protein L11 methyltransferase
LIRLAVRVEREHAELVLAELLELAPSGVEEVTMGNCVEYAVYGAPGELPSVPDLRAAAGASEVQVVTTEIADDWSERWRAYHRPVVVDGRLTIRPPWEARGATPIDIVIDPGQAFGTGAHPTTRMCLELMLALDARGAFLDLGCGSGVLAIAAARLGFAPVMALDSDAAAVNATRANAAANEVEIDIRRFDLRAEPVPAVPTVAANLIAPLLEQWAPTLVVGTERVIASGLLAAEADRVTAAFALRARSRLQDGGWVALLLER